MAFLQTRYIVLLLLAQSILFNFLFNIYVVSHLQSHLDQANKEGVSRVGPPSQRQWIEYRQESPSAEQRVRWKSSPYGSAGLNCQAHGGPSTPEEAAEMVY